MESERLQFNWEQAAKAVVMVSLGARSEETIALARNLICAASNDYPQLSEVNFLPIPLPVPQLETWTYYLAAQTVAKWRDTAGENISIEAIAKDLGIVDIETTQPLIAALDKNATGSSLSAELAARLQLQQVHQQQLSNSSLHQWLEQEVASLSDWFVPSAQKIDKTSAFSNSESSVGCLSQLQTNADTIASKTRLQLQEFFVSLRQSGLRSLLKMLKNLGETLTSTCANYEAQRQNCLRREGAAWRAYYSLSAQLENRTLIPRQRKVEREALLQAISKACNFKLEAEIYTLAAQIVGSLRQQTHTYAVTLAQADALLASLQNSFVKHCTTEPIFASILKQYLADRVDLSKLRRKIEVLVGSPLNQWGSLKSAQQALLREQILAYMRPICIEIYAECYRSLINISPEVQIHANTSSQPLTFANLPQQQAEQASWQSLSDDRYEVELAENNLERDRTLPDLKNLPFAEA